jgi:hypothetical protein
MVNSIGVTAAEVLRKHESTSEALRSRFARSRRNFVRRSRGCERKEKLL